MLLDIVLALLALGALVWLGQGESKIATVGYYILMVLDVLCIKFLFPTLPNISSNISIFEAIFISVICAVLGGKMLNCLRDLSTAGDEIYVTVAPFTNAIMIMAWSALIPSIGLSVFWPSALIAGFILHYIDIGLVRPWTFYTMRKFK